jgi:hypothetical protein
VLELSLVHPLLVHADYIPTKHTINETKTKTTTTTSAVWEMFVQLHGKITDVTSFRACMLIKFLSTNKQQHQEVTAHCYEWICCSFCLAITMWEVQENNTAWFPANQKNMKQQQQEVLLCYTVWYLAVKFLQASGGKILNWEVEDNTNTTGW